MKTAVMKFERDFPACQDPPSNQDMIWTSSEVRPGMGNGSLPASRRIAGMVQAGGAGGFLWDSPFSSLHRVLFLD